MKRANIYNAPTVEFIEVIVEAGFDVSGDIEPGQGGGHL